MFIMAFLNNDGQFTDESLSLLMRDLRGFITATENERPGFKDKYSADRPSKIAISEPILHDPKQIPEGEYVKSEEMCKGCTANHTNTECSKNSKNDICWHKAHQHAKALLESLNKLV